METKPDDLPARWRERAEYLRQYGDPACARLWELAATELEAALAAHGQEALSLTEAAKLSGLTADHLGQLVKQGRIPNAGRDGAPRIRRGDLPVKRVGGPGRPTRRTETPPLAAEREQCRRIARSFTAKKEG
jgi:hypothetical protein